MLTLREIALYLEDIETPVGRAINLLIMGLILLSSVIFVAETYPLSEPIRISLDTIDTLILVIFVFEYSIRLYYANSKIEFIFSPFSFIDLIAIIPFFFAFISI